jgi:hypothetical protein
MSIHVLFLICSLIKYRIAPLHRASEGFFPCVNAQMIKQIVPFWEKFVAPMVLTQESSCESRGRRPNVLNHYKALG